MPQWAGSCWYYIRYLQPWNDSAPVDPGVEQYWLPVDLYMGAPICVPTAEAAKFLALTTSSLVGDTQQVDHPVYTASTGGAEHAVLHLLYARFWHKVLYDLGIVSTKEPFQRLVSQGMILGEVRCLCALSCRQEPCLAAELCPTELVACRWSTQSLWTKTGAMWKRAIHSPQPEGLPSATLWDNMHVWQILLPSYIQSGQSTR